jgi:HK97 family phage portal protein
MTILDTIRDRVANAIRPQRQINPNNRRSGDRNVGTVSAGNELSASIRGTVFACLQHRANALANLDFKSYKMNNFSLEENGSYHWTNELLRNPNPYFTRSQTFNYLENWLSINGNAFIWTPTNGYRVPVQMWVLNPTRVRVIKGSDSFIDGYVYQSAQEGNIAIPEKEMIHLARIHPAARQEEIIGMNMFGVGLVTAALEYANIDREVSAYLARLFKNNTVPPLIAKFAERMDYDEWERLKARWNEELPDYKLRAMLGGGLGLELPPKGELSISYDSVSSDTRSQIAQVFGVPPGMLTGEYQNRATAEVQWAIFRQNTIDPEASYIAEEFSRHFQRWEEGVLIEADKFQYDDPSTQMQQEEFELKWGIKTINDSRKQRGYDPIIGGDVPLIANGFVPLSINSEGNVNQVVQKSNAKPFETQDTRSELRPLNSAPIDITTANMRDRDYFWRQFDTITTDNSVGIEKIISKAFQDIQNKVIEKSLIDIKALEGMELTKEQMTQIQDSLNEASEIVRVELAKELGIDPEDVPLPLSQQIDTLTKQSTEKITESISVARAELIKVVRANATRDPNELKDILMRKFGQLKESRAKMIARTTSSNVTSGVQYSVYRSKGIKMAWLTQRDGAVRPAHQAVDGQIPNESGLFNVGGQMTTRPLGEGLSAANSVNCRCQLFPVR